MVLRRSGIGSDGIGRSDGEQRERPPYAALNCRWGGNQSAAVVAGVAEPECPSRRMRVDHILPLSRLGRCNGRRLERRHSRLRTLATGVRAAQRAGRVAPTTATATPAAATTISWSGLSWPRSALPDRVKPATRAKASIR